LTVFVGEGDRWHHRPLYAEIVHRAHAAGLAGASGFRGVEGYGASAPDSHHPALVGLLAFLPRLVELVSEALVLLDPVEVIRYVGRGGS